MGIVDTIGLDNVLNAILVNENVRPAMLVQPADYGETTGTDPKTHLIIQTILDNFPDLVCSEDYEIYQGAIISKTDYNGHSFISLEEMGKILGYPCYREFGTIDPDNVTYMIQVSVLQKDVDKHTELFTNKCKDTTKLIEFTRIAEEATDAFQKETYKDILDGVHITKVYVDTFPIIPTQHLIRKIIERKSFTKDEQFTVQNILVNLDTGIDLKHFQTTNPVHRGLLLGILLRESHDMLSPFYPLQNYPKQYKEVTEITREWETDVLKVLHKTRHKKKPKTRRKVASSSSSSSSRTSRHSPT